MTSALGNLIVRDEAAGDRAGVRRVNLSAFDTAAEADLVEALREQASPLVSLVAEAHGQIVGHIMFSPASLAGNPGLKIMGLAPMAVAPQHQHQGIGSKLVLAGLDRCRQLGCVAVVVLGHPSFYPRFGFRPASAFGIRCEYEAPDEAFMLVKLQADGLDDAAGMISYHPAFRSV